MENWKEEEEQEEGGRRKEEGDNEAADKEGVFKTRPHSDTSLDWNRP